VGARIFLAAIILIAVATVGFYRPAPRVPEPPPAQEGVPIDWSASHLRRSGFICAIAVTHD